MTNQIQVFNNTEFGNIRTLEINGEPYFVGKDVATALGYSNSRKAIGDHVDDEDKGVTNCDTLGGNQQITVINESGLYSLIFASKLPSAKRFKRWVTSEVLPMLRKTGKYSITDDEPEQPPVSLKERMEIAKLIAKTPKNRLHMVAKIFEPVLGIGRTKTEALYKGLCASGVDVHADKENKRGILISVEDYAVAMVDELEKPQHHFERFTVAY